jgi:protein-L-isoaspartate(D-aspartate) O-methyltransferase
MSENSHPVDILAFQQRLIEQLHQHGLLHNPRLATAFNKVPRHLFLPHLAPEQAYRDEAIVTKKLGGEWVSSSSQPSMMALMLQQLALEPGQRVLEIGAGTGYNAALMAELVGPGGHVTTVDIDEDIVQAARSHLAAADYGSVEVVQADGGYGYAPNGPYDRMILTVGADDLLPAWIEQLKPGGLLVLPLALFGVQKSVAFVHGGDHLASLSLFDCGFMRLRGVFATAAQSAALPHYPQVVVETHDQPLPDLVALEQTIEGEGSDYQCELELSLGQLLGALPFWFALRGYLPCSFQLMANEDEEVQAPLALITPSTYGISSMQALRWGNSLLLWLLPENDEADPGVKWSQRFPLAVRLLHPQPGLLEQLRADLAAWRAQKKEFNQQIRLYAYPRGTQIAPTPDTALIEKRWTSIVVSYGETTTDDRRLTTTSL